jgi:hypothetical protein
LKNSTIPLKITLSERSALGDVRPYCIDSATGNDLFLSAGLHQRIKYYDLLIFVFATTSVFDF